MDFHNHNHQQQQDQYDSSMVSNTHTTTATTLNLLSEQQQQQQQINCGLTRYRSAPSSYFAGYHDVKSSDYLGDELDNFLNGLMPSNHISVQETSRQEEQDVEIMQIQSQEPHDQQKFNHVDDDSYNFSSWNRIDKGGITNSNLIRYNSSPAGLIAAGNIANEYCGIKGMENIGATFASTTNRYTTLSSGLVSPPLPKIATRSMGENDVSKRSESAHITGIPVVPWDDSSLLMSNNFLEGLRNEDNQSFSNKDDEVQNAATTERGAPTLLSRHLSLPTELSGVETLMQDSVLCKLRAKRGCATHPRSIAERVRRTRISERMRKLQELVPNMEKQSNTADMLDMAVDYIKGLQNQVKALSEKRATCTCSKYH